MNRAIYVGNNMVMCEGNRNSMHFVMDSVPGHRAFEGFQCRMHTMDCYGV